MDNRIHKKIVGVIKSVIKSLLPSKQILVLSNGRDLKEKPVIYRFRRHKGVCCLRLRGELIAAPGDQAHLSLEFFDEFARRLRVASTDFTLDFTKDNKCFSYMGPGLFEIRAKIPAKTFSVAMQLRARAQSEVLLAAGFEVSSLYKNVTDDHLAIFEKLDFTDMDSIEDQIQQCCTGLSKKEYREAVSQLYWSKEDNYPENVHIGKCLLKVKPSRRLASELKAKINHAGDMYFLSSFLKFVNELGISGFEVAYTRVTDDIEWMEGRGNINSIKQIEFEAPSSSKALYILHNSLPYNSGGYATRTHGLLKKLNDLGVNVAALTRPGFPTDHQKYISFALPDHIPCDDQIDGITYLRCSQNVKRSSLTFSNYTDIFANEIIEFAIGRSVGLIHAASNHPNAFSAIKAGAALNIPTVYEVRGLWEITRMSREHDWDKTDVFRFSAMMEAEACKQATKVLTITKALKEIMVDRGVQPEKITVVPNCVNISDFPPNLIRSKELEDNLGLLNKVVIGYIGSVVNYEGLDDLIRAVQLLKKSTEVEFVLMIVGDGAYLSELKSLAHELDVEEIVLFVGRVPHDQVSEYYSLVDIAPFPRKPFLVCEAVSPLKPFEAMASQKAVIVSGCAALTEIVEHKVTGLVFDKGSVESLMDSLKLLVEDDTLRKYLAENGRSWVKSHRDWSHSAAIVNSVYKEVLNDN